MTNEIIETVKSCLTLLIAILCLIFSKSRFKENKRYAVKYENSSILLILRLILTYLLKIISIIILIGICTNKLDVFIAFYVFTPMLICLQLIFFYTNDTKAMFTLVKGFYYLGLSIISLIQFISYNFDKALHASAGVAVVDLFDTWCLPFKMLSPVIEEAAEDMPEIQFYKVDVDEAPELARSFKVMSVPTLAFFKNGELVKKNVGAVSYEELEELINSVK